MGGITKEERFVRYRKTIVEGLSLAETHLELFERLSECLKKNYRTEMTGRTWRFWSFTIDAHRDAALAHIFRIVDKDKDVVSIWRFLELARANPDLFCKEAYARRSTSESEDESNKQAKLENHRAICSQNIDEDATKLERLPLENLRKWRHKYYAHTDERVALNGINVRRKYPVTPDEFKAVITAVYAVVNRYSVAFDGGSMVRAWRMRSRWQRSWTLFGSD